MLGQVATQQVSGICLHDSTQIFARTSEVFEFQSVFSLPGVREIADAWRMQVFAAASTHPAVPGHIPRGSVRVHWP